MGEVNKNGAAHGERSGSASSVPAGSGTCPLNTGLVLVVSQGTGSQQFLKCCSCIERNTPHRLFKQGTRVYLKSASIIKISLKSMWVRVYRIRTLCM